jgi:hypothetical protein
MVARIQSDVTHGEVGASVAIQVGGGEGDPPAASGATEAQLLACVVETFPLAVQQTEQCPPFAREEKIDPAVVIDVGPAARRHDADLL